MLTGLAWPGDDMASSAGSNHRNGGVYGRRAGRRGRPPEHPPPRPPPSRLTPPPGLPPPPPRPHPATVSPWFRIGPASSLYAGAVANALSFYQNERDGPGFIPSALRTAPGHLNDANAMTFRAPNVSPNGNFRGSLRRFATGVRINATGGWWDAGDYLKFVETTSYTVAMMLQGIASFPAQLGGGAHRHGGAPGGIAPGGRPEQVSFTAEAKFGLDFLQRMWNQRTRTLYFQI